MKAFVIKNKEGKYFSGYDTESIAHFDCDNIVDTIKYRTDKYELQEIKSVDIFKDCEVVEITIAEGDLEQENKILKETLRLACDFMEEKCDWNCNSLVVYSTKKEIYDYFIKQAKENIKKEEK